MKIDLKILNDILPIYGVLPLDQIKGVKEAIASGIMVKAPAKHEPILKGNDYDWNDAVRAYIYQK